MRMPMSTKSGGRVWMMRLKEVFSRPGPENGSNELRVIEVEKAQRVAALDPDSAQSVQTLQSHPGFLYLLAKLKFHRNLLKENLASNRQASIEDVLVLQSGIAWAGWLAHELEKAVGFQKTAPAAPNPGEREIFEESQRQLEILR